MKFSIISQSKDNQKHLSTLPAEVFFEKIRSDLRRGLISSFRQAMPFHLGPQVFMRYGEMARVVPAVELRRQDDGVMGMQRFNGLVTLEVKNLTDAEERERVKQAAMSPSSTFAAFIGASGQTVKILVLVSRMDGTLPSTETEAEEFYALAYRQLLPMYDGVLRHRVARMTPLLRHSFLRPLDPAPMVNPSATPFRVNPFVRLPEESPLDDEPDPISPQQKQLEADIDAYTTYEQIYEQCCQRAHALVKDFSAEHYSLYLHALANELFEAGLPQEEAMVHIWNHWRYKNAVPEEYIRSIVEATYEEDDLPAARQHDGESEMLRRMRRKLEQRYLFRRNTVMGYVEMRPNHTWTTSWTPVDAAIVNGLVMQLQMNSIPVWDRDVKRYIYSSYIPVYDPIDHFLTRLGGKWDGRDRIGQLARRVPTDNPQWESWFHTWFLAMVAQWQGRNPNYGNSVVPLLISEQGNHKSDFCRRLLPPELRRWGYTDNLAMREERQVHLAMSQMLLINLDEFNSISAKMQEGLLKNLLQLPSVKVRRPYGRHIEEVPRLASFIATTNLADVLTDPTGSRRFIGVQVKGSISIDSTIDYDQLYAQAIAELDNGRRYWFTDADNAEIMHSNRRFRMQSNTELFFHEYFEPTDDEGEGEWMTAAAILTEMKRRAKSLLQAPSTIAFGRILNGNTELRRKQKNGTTAYLVKKKVDN